jgi:hypothetical protein
LRVDWQTRIALIIVVAAALMLLIVAIFSPDNRPGEAIIPLLAVI